MVQKKYLSRTIFNVCNYAFMALLSISILIPFLNCFSLSLSTPEAVRAGEVSLFPVGFNLEA